MKQIRRFAILFLFVNLQLAAQSTFTTEQAKSRVGENGTVCGVVASAHFAASTRGQPTFLNLDKGYPNEVFTVLIWGSDRAKFGAPERDYEGKRICATGAIQEIVAYPRSLRDSPVRSQFSADAVATYE